MIIIYSPASFHLRYIFPLFTSSAEIIQHGASEVLFIEEHTAGIVVLRASPLCCTCSISHPHNSLIPLLCLQILKLSFPSLEFEFLSDLHKPALSAPPCFEKDISKNLKAKWSYKSVCCIL